EWLNTVDLQPYLQGLQVLGFSCPDHTRREGEDIVRRWQAVKLLVKAKSTVSSPVNLAREILAAHTRACQEVGEGVRTLVIVNTVKKARDVIDALRSAVLEGVEDSKRGKGEVESSKQTSVGRPLLVLLHSRFRPSDRERMVRSALATPGQFGSIVVSTQVVEAGVDISAAVLFAEVAPWASLVQRFGRCNRRGEYPKASVYWIDVNSKDVHPYAAEDLKASREQLTQLERVGPSDIHKHMENLDEKQKASLLRFDHTHVIRRRDLMDLFDTTPDLTGNDIVIDHFVREREDSDVYAFWRNWEQAPQNRPPSTLGAPSRVELCSVPVDQFRDFTRVHRGLVWHWNFLDEAWESAEPGGIVPGFTYMIHTNAGGYSPERGWDPATTERVASLTTPLLEQDSNDGDSLSRVGVWQSISDHADDVCQEVDIIGEALALDEDLLCVLRLAARWHDRGKAHLVFQDALPLQDGQRNGNGPWAKAQGAWKRYSRKHFRHELASALAVLSDSSVLDAIARMTEPMRQSTGADPLRLCTPNELRDLVAYLVAAHHGKVRFSIRSLPDENCPRPSVDERDRLRRFARGLWDGDTLPETDLGGGWKAPAVCLSLEPMELGLCQEEPFVGQPSWVSRMLNLVEKLGAFQVAYLEALLRAADIRASRAAEQRQNRPFIESRH
ncbi:MAG TPA: HD domain-containing protein, partial [Candidatus Obscuribacterales bacterium]